MVGMVAAIAAVNYVAFVRNVGFGNGGRGENKRGLAMLGPWRSHAV